MTKGYYFPYHDIIDSLAEEYETLEDREPAKAEELLENIHFRMRAEIFKDEEKAREPDWKYLTAAYTGFESVKEVEGWHAGKPHPGGYVTTLEDVTMLLRSVLIVDSKQRPSAEEILKNNVCFFSLVMLE